MTHEAALALTAKIVADTVLHMADQAGVSFESALIAIATTKAGKARFSRLMTIATGYVAAT